MRWRKMAVASFPVIASAVASASLAAQLLPPLGAHDPGVRGGGCRSRRAARRLDAGQLRFFNAGKEEFEEEETVPEGLAPASTSTRAEAVIPSPRSAERVRRSIPKSRWRQRRERRTKYRSS